MDSSTTITATITSLLPITKSAGGRDVVSARELHRFLESRQDFSTWIKNRIEKYDFVEKQDYGVFHNFVEHATGRAKTIEYAITLDMAKELAMVEGNERGKQARRYFIAVEKAHRLQQAPALPATYAEALRQLAEKVESEERLQQQLQLATRQVAQANQHVAHTSQQLQQVQQVVELQQPAVEFVQKLVEAGDLVTMEEAAKTLAIKGLGRNNLFNLLVKKKVFSTNKLPYQRYVDAGYFQLKQTSFEHQNGQVHLKNQVMVTSVRGIEFLRRLLAKSPV